MTTSWSGLFLDWAAGMTDYISRHTFNYNRIQTCLDYLHAISSSAVSVMDVSRGLREIFDRIGIIGIDSYRPPGCGAKNTPGRYNLAYPDCWLTIPRGAYWNTVLFLMKDLTTTFSMGAKPSGTYYVKIDSAGNPFISSDPIGPDEDVPWSFHWENHDETAGSPPQTVHVRYISNQTLLVEVLFDGDDFANCLANGILPPYTALSDRLSDLDRTVISDFLYIPGAGLDFYIHGGKIRNADGFIWVVDPITVELTPCTHGQPPLPNYVEIDPATGEVSANTTGWTTGWISLWYVETAWSEIGGDAIDNVADRRCWLAIGGSGGGGGGNHSQNTDVGTSSQDFTLGLTNTGEPTHDMKLKAKRGNQPTVAIRWNEASDTWQFTNDGTNYEDIGALSGFDLGGQVTPKYVPMDEPPLVLSATGRGPSADYEDLDLSSFVDAPDGITAVALRVIFLDSFSPASADYYVRFKKKGLLTSPEIAYTVYSPARLDLSRPQTIIISPDETNMVQYFVNASGMDTANVLVYLVGYYKNVLGVGTQNKNFGEVDLEVVKDSVNVFELSGFCKRGLVRYISVEQTITGESAPTGSYDVRIYGKSPFDRDQLMYEAVDLEMDVAWIDYLPWFYYNEDGNDKLYLEIQHNGTDFDGLFNVSLKAEQFA